MGLLESIGNLFRTGAEKIGIIDDYDPYVHLVPGPDPVVMPPAAVQEFPEWFPRVPEAGYDVHEFGGGWGESLWNKFKELVPTGLRAYEAYLKANPDKSGLVYRLPQATAEALLKRERERKDYLIHTPYPRQTSGTTASPPLIVKPGEGIPPALLIAGAIAAFLLLRKKRR